MKPLVCAAVAVFCVAAVPVEAKVVTYAYEGEIEISNSQVFDFSSGSAVTYQDPAVQAAFDPFVGQTIRMTFSFEDDPALNPDRWNTNPNARAIAVQEVIVTFAGLTFTSSGYLRIQNNGSFGTQPLPADLYGVEHTDIDTFTFPAVSGPTVGGLPAGGNSSAFQLGLYDPTASAFSDDSLPATQPDPADFPETTLATNNYLSFFFSDALEANVFALAEVTATELRIVEFPAVPLPASAVLLLAGLGGMAVTGRRKRG